MAGNYMNDPSDRIAWDRDGSILTHVTLNGAVNLVPVSDRRTVNSENESTVPFSNIRALAIVFPIPMDLAAVFFSASPTLGNGFQGWSVETSKDTTNGIDGTWTSQFITGIDAFQDVKPNYRMATKLLTLQTNSSSSDLRGIRFVPNFTSGNNSSQLKAIHIYGVPSTIATKDRLAFWHPTDNAKVIPSYFDWGNVPRSTSADRRFRIKNLSETKNATDIDLYVEALTQGSPTVDGMHTFSIDGGATFHTALTLERINAGQVSPEIIVRRTVPSNAQVSVWSARIAADVNLWESI